MRQVHHFISGAHKAGSDTRTGDIFDPGTGQLQRRFAWVRRLTLTKPCERRWSPSRMGRHKPAAARARHVSVRNCLSKYGRAGGTLSSEHGKVIADSKGDIQRGLEVIEFACGIPHLLKGEYTQGAGPGIDIYAMHSP